MIKTVMKVLALVMFLCSLIYMTLADVKRWVPQPVTVHQLTFLTSCIMLTILSKGK